VDPAQKEITWGSLRANIKSLRVILDEMKKCILVCSNCHKELHSDRSTTVLPPNILMLTDADVEAFLDNSHKSFQTDVCPICSGPKPEWLVTCGNDCMYTRTGKVDWFKIDLVERFKTSSAAEIAGELGCNVTSVMKRLRKIASEEFITSYVDSRKNHQRRFQTTKDELEALLKNHSLVAIGKLFGVSDNAVRKRCKLLQVAL
jgi:hypothetical protein